MKFSPGTYHKSVPKDREANLKFRLHILRKSRNDVNLQRGLMEICRRDILFWFNAFVFQFNPKTRETGPWISWPYQDTAIVGGDIEIGDETRYQHGILSCVEDQKDARWPKSREGGASWIALGTAWWLCRFHSNIKVRLLSRTEDSVNAIDDPDSLFEKLRILMRHLPDWMMQGIDPKKSRIVFENKTGRSHITSSANVDSAGVGGRDTLMIVDEFGQYDKNGEMIYDFTTDTADCRLFIFTHKDNVGMAYKLCYDPKFRSMREIMTHWSQHPTKRPGLYRFNDEEHTVEIIDKKFDFTSICAHGVSRKKVCGDCKGKFQEFEFVREARPVGGPCPGIRSPWYDSECRRRNERDIQMNLDIDPRGASDKFFDAYRVKLLTAEYAREPVWVGDLEHDKLGNPIALVQNKDGKFKLWFTPKSEKEFPVMACGAAVDVSAGSGYSPSCISVINARTGEKVAEYSNANIYAPDFATLACAFLRMFKDERKNNPLLVWEIQGSSAFQRRLIDELHYAPGYIKREEDALGKPRDNKGRYGWNPTPKSILTLLEEYRDAIYNQNCINRSQEALDETLKLVYVGNTVEYRASGKKMVDGSGAGVHHGDMVRADALAWKMVKELGLDRWTQVEKMKEYPDPRTFAGREALAEIQEREEEYAY